MRPRPKCGRLIEPAGEGTPFEQLRRQHRRISGLDRGQLRAWAKLMQSAATLPAARELVEGFREQTMELRR